MSRPWGSLDQLCCRGSDILVCGLRGAVVSVVAFWAKGRGFKSTHGCSHTVQKLSISPRLFGQCTLNISLPFTIYHIIGAMLLWQLGNWYDSYWYQYSNITRLRECGVRLWLVTQWKGTEDDMDDSNRRQDWWSEPKPTLMDWTENNEHSSDTLVSMHFISHLWLSGTAKTKL